MFLSNPDIQHVSNVKIQHQLSETEKKLNDITLKLSKLSNNCIHENNDIDKINQKTKSLSIENNQVIWDWTKSYDQWNNYEDIEDLISNKTIEEKKLDSILNKKDALGHYHSHSIEKDFYELSENKKFELCENNQLLGNYLYKEGLFIKAAEHYQIAIGYYEYCFPNDTKQQLLLDQLRYTCLCNISLCEIHLGLYRKAIEHTTIVIKESTEKYSKAYYRRAQAYRYLDEYELSIKDLNEALLLCPNDYSIISELNIIQKLSQRYNNNKQEFAKSILNNHSRTTLDHSKMLPVINQQDDDIDLYTTETNNSNNNSINNNVLYTISMPLEPIQSLELQLYHRYKEDVIL